MFPTFSCSARFMSWSTTRPETWAVEGFRDSRRRRRFVTFEIVNGRQALFIPPFFRIAAYSVFPNVAAEEKNSSALATQRKHILMRLLSLHFHSALRAHKLKRRHLVPNQKHQGHRKSRETTTRGRGRAAE
jgi:hypothetical protein